MGIETVIVRKWNPFHGWHGRFSDSEDSTGSHTSKPITSIPDSFFEQHGLGLGKPAGPTKVYKPKPLFQGNQHTTEGHPELAPDYHKITDTISEPPLDSMVKPGYTYQYKSYNKETKQTEIKTGYSKPFEMQKSAGMVLIEPGSGGKVWIVQPRNGYGGYKATFPKGRLEDDPTLTMQQSAHRELFEETGLHARIIGHLGDYEGDTTVSRMYVGIRTGGKPMTSKETEGVKLVTPMEAYNMLNRGRDKKIVGDVVWNQQYINAKNGLIKVRGKLLLQKFNPNHDANGEFASADSDHTNAKMRWLREKHVSGVSKYRAQCRKCGWTSGPVLAKHREDAVFDFEDHVDSKIQKFNPNHDDRGRFSDSDSAAGVYDEKGTLHTDNIKEAAVALAAGKNVELNQPREVATLLKELHNEALSAQKLGKEAGPIDLAHLSVRGTNLFAQNSKGIPRVNMPQLSGVPLPGSLAASIAPNPQGFVDLTNDFIASLRQRGVKVETGTEQAAYLRATQNQLGGRQIAGMMDAIQSGKAPELASRPLVVSKDNYILDGHHTWATMVGLDSMDNILGNNTTMNIRRVDMGITELLKEAQAYADKMGIPSIAVKKFNENHDARGRFDSGSGEGLYAHALRTGGFTIAQDGTEPTKGYAVAHPGHSGIFPDSLDPRQGEKLITAWRQREAAKLAEPGMHMGGWHDKDAHQVVMDATKVFGPDQREEAIAAGIAQNQKSIYDIEKGEEIPTGGTGD